MTGAKQQKIEQPEIPETASIQVLRKKIPLRLPPWDARVLNSHYQKADSDQTTARFTDSEELRQVLRKYGLLEQKQ